MKIATFNVNGVNARLPTLLRWLDEARPDIRLQAALVRAAQRPRHAAALLAAGAPTVLAGGYNVMPTELDVAQPERWREDARAFLLGQGLEVEAWAREVDGKFISAFVRANKPAKAACRAPECCS
jgi:exodeoxyribonuclease-3